MNKIFIGLSYFMLAAFTLLIFTGCDTVSPDPFSSDMTVSPSPAGDHDIIDVSPSPDMSPDSSDDTLMSDVQDLGEGIKDFVEGTIVDLADVPEIVAAVQDKYEDVTITGISHAIHLNEQVYKVLFTDDNSTTHTVYVSADGKTITEAVEPESSDEPGDTPSASPSDKPTEEG